MRDEAEGRPAVKGERGLNLEGPAGVAPGEAVEVEAVVAIGEPERGPDSE
ncbi:MAG: hypothetical protein ABIK37_02950 [candidate division WOR-3 bacterium]